MLLAMVGLLTAMHRQNRALREEAERLAANYRAMTDTVTARRSTSGRSVRAVQTLSLTPDELTAPLFAQRLATVADIGVKRKRVNELTTVGTEMRMEVKLQPLPASPEGEERGGDDECTDAPRSVLSSANAGTILRNDADRAMIYAYHDPWVDIAVDIGATPFAVDAGSSPSHPDDRTHRGASVHCADRAAAAISLVVRDTLTIVEHRVPRRIWFIRFGTKCVKREVVALCPYTEVVMAERIVAM
jgi:hypothetical protein